MPRVVNPHAVAGSLPGVVKQVKAITNDIKGKARNAFNSLTIGAGGLIVSGVTQLTGGITGGLGVTGGFSVAGAISATTTVSAGTALSAASLALTGGGTANAFTGSDLYTLNGPTFNITGGRVACWLETATGRVGMATSSERFKVILGDGDIDVRALLDQKIVRYQRIEELAKRDDPDSENYVGPDYAVRVETGLIAERMNEAGLSEWVFFEDDGVTALGIHYSELVVPLLAAVQSLDARLRALENR